VWRLLGYEKRLDKVCAMGYAYVRKASTNDVLKIYFLNEVILDS
jgi:hypothetical protein